MPWGIHAFVENSDNGNAVIVPDVKNDMAHVWSTEQALYQVIALSPCGWSFGQLSNLLPQASDVFQPL